MTLPKILIVLSFSFFVLPANANLSHLPKGPCPQQLDYSYYTLCYSPEHRQAVWTKHTLTRELLSGKQKRTNDYRADFFVEDPVDEKDYRGSGFDRGHMVPAGDMKLNRQSMSQTFYMTNMSPQRPQLNQNTWAKIENRIRQQVRTFGTAHVVTAPVLQADLPRIRSGVSVPEFYYKLAYFPEAGFMEAYWVENRSYKGTPIAQLRVSVREVEDLTGFDFYSELPADLQEELETRQGLDLAAQQ